MATLLCSVHTPAPARRVLRRRAADCFCSLRQVPEWTKCSSREKRKEKKVEKPFYSDSEGESGPTESADSGESAAPGVSSIVQQKNVCEFASSVGSSPSLTVVGGSPVAVI